MRRMLSTRGRFQKRIASPSLASSSSVRRRAASTRCSPLWPRFPATFRRPIVVAQHLDPRRQSHLGEILSSRSVLPVRTVSGDQPLEPGIVYVIAADRDVEISDHALTVTAPTGTSPSPRPSVDRLLATAARTFADELVAVILTGTGSDGATGAQAVKAHGGTVIVQNPDTATYPGMPLAVPSSAIDIVADLEAIGPLLGDLVSGAYSIPASSDDEDLHAFLDRVRERTGLDFSAYKRATIVRRLQRRMAAAGAATLPDYRRYMERHPEELQRLVASFLIKVTEFFRDPELFTYLRDHVLPGLVSEARERGELRIWSAGCATGEEAYTLAMLVSDLLGEDAESCQSASSPLTSPATRSSSPAAASTPRRPWRACRPTSSSGISPPSMAHSKCASRSGRWSCLVSTISAIARRFPGSTSSSAATS